MADRPGSAVSPRSVAGLILSAVVGLGAGPSTAAAQGTAIGADGGRRSRITAASRVQPTALAAPLPAALPNAPTTTSAATANPGGQALRLEDCIAIALREQPAIAAQQQAVDASEHLVGVARSGFLPRANASVTYADLSAPLSVNIQNPLGSGPARKIQAYSDAFFGIAAKQGGPAALAALGNQSTNPLFNTTVAFANHAIPSTYNTEILGQSVLLAQASVDQPLYTGGKVRSKYEQARLGVDVARWDEARSRQETIYNVTAAYQGIQLAEALIRLTDDTAGRFAAIAILARTAREEEQEGATVADELRASSLRNLTEADGIKARRGREIAYAALRQAMGTSDRLAFVIAEPELSPLEAPPDLDSVMSQAIASRPELAKARIGFLVADLETKSATAAFHPNVGVFMRAISLNSNYNSLTPSNYVAVGVGADIPIFAGGSRIAQARRARSQLGQAAKTRELAESLIALEVQKTYQEYLEQAEKLPLLRRAVDDARKAVHSYEVQYDADAIEESQLSRYFENLITSRILLAQALGQYYQAVNGYNNAVARLRLVAGVL